MLPGSQNSTDFTFERIVEIIIKLAVLYFLLGWCLQILQPFVLILMWAGVIAIALFPLYRFFTRIFGGKKTIASIVLTLIMLSILILPSLLIAQSLYEGINHIRELHRTGQLIISPPGPGTDSWPAIAKPVKDLWQLASENLQEALLKYSSQLKTVGAVILGAFAGFGMGVLQFVASIIIAGVLLAFSTSIGVASSKIFVKLAGAKGDNYVNAIINTVRSVVKGILGVAVIQAAMAGIGFFIAGVPFAGLWTVACLVLAIVQVGSGPVAIPVMIYMFSVSSTLNATILSIWLVITLISDNVLKPLLLGRGASAPMLVVFLGAIGGFITSGFLGLFLGAVILTIGYQIFMVWLDSSNEVVPEIK